MSEQFNQLTPAEHERLSLLMEECGEVVQVIGKIMRHGYERTHPDGGPTNRELLGEELGDLITALTIMTCHNDIDTDVIWERSCEKMEKIGTYLHHTTVDAGGAAE